MRTGVAELAPLLGVAQACRVLGVPRASYYRHRRLSAQATGTSQAPSTSDGDAPPSSSAAADRLPPLPAPGVPIERAGARSGACQARALSADERAAVLAVLNSERFVDCAPRTIYATLLDEQQYLCSWRTMYRILAEAEQVRERRNQVRRTGYTRPELLATAPNQLWSWDITKLRGPAKWTVLLSVCHPGRLQSRSGWLADCRTRRCRTCRSADRRNLHQGGHHTSAIDDTRRPRECDDVESRGSTAE